MVSLKKRSEGFTIVELLIVIIIIGILSALVIVTFTGIQQKGRNSERQTDLNAISSHIAAYHAENGSFPTLANLQSASWVSDNLKGLPAEALNDPRATADTKGLAATASPTQYGYACVLVGEDACGGYTLSAKLEGKTGDAANYTKKSE